MTSKCPQFGISSLKWVNFIFSSICERLNQLTDLDVLIFNPETNTLADDEGICKIERKVEIQLIPLSEIVFDFMYHVVLLDQDEKEFFVSDFFEHKAAGVQVGRALDGNIIFDKLEDSNLNVKFVIIKKESTDDDETTLIPKPKEVESSSSNDLAAAFKRLFLEMEDSDIDLIARGEIIPAHKLILCARSVYLKEQLYGLYRANRGSPVDNSLNDSCSRCVIGAFDMGDEYSPLVVKEFVRFLYYAEVEWENFTEGCQTFEMFKLATELGDSNLAKMSLERLVAVVQELDGDDILELLDLAYDRKMDNLFSLGVMIFHA